MYLEIPTDRADPYKQTAVRFPTANTMIWWEQLEIQTVADPRVVGVVFPDAHAIHPDFIARLHAQAAAMPTNARGVGGKKVRDAVTWGMPAAQLLTQRALLLFCYSRKVASAHVLDRWANVMYYNDYSTPHCHFDAEGAVVYAVDPGEQIPQQPLDGSFELIDPRIPACCPSLPERPQRGLSPTFIPGMMLLFPAEFIHHVRPYSGQRPRITLAWNISAGPPPQDRVIDPTQQLAYKITTKS